jgi:4-hydroxy-3-methylbut-2-enyl diphosphate reductase
MNGLLIVAPMRLEALLIGSATRTVSVRRTGIGCERSLAAARELCRRPAAAVLAMGFCGGLEETSKPGDVIVSDRVLRNEFDRNERRVKATACVGAETLAATLTDRGLRVRRGMVVSVAGTGPVRGSSRAKLRDTGAIAVDMESAWLARGLDGWPFGAVRVVVDTPARELTRPLATLTGGIRAAVVLRRVASAVDELVRECGVHTVFAIDS